MFIVDAHLDLAYTSAKYNRNLHLPLAAIRQAEIKKPALTGIATVNYEEIQKAGIGLVFGSIFLMPASWPTAFHPPTTYKNSEEAHKHGMAQLDYYHRLADEDPTFRLIRDLTELEEVVQSHETENPLLGILPAMEGAAPIREPEEAELWYERGLRVIGLAWDDTPYAPGNYRQDGGLTKAGQHLLEVMASFGFIADVSHLAEKASLQTLERYEGVVVATHTTARVLAPEEGMRLLTDTQIRLMGEREGMIGVALFNQFLKRGHMAGEPKEFVPITYVVDHIDHICQILGDASHVGIGSDLDGGFGYKDIPAEMDSIADLPMIADVLKERGYEETDIAGILGQNWLNLLRRAWAN